MRAQSTVEIQSRDYWFKVVEMLQQNWALVDRDMNLDACTVFFVQDASGVFDRIHFPSIVEAEAGLRRNGFARFSEDIEAQKFLAPPRPPFLEAHHPNGPIYSSGRFWQNEFEAAIALLTAPLNGQYPRPWMTDLKDPLKASVFIVGRNQAKGYSTVGLTHQRHIDALFNRSGESCRGLYDELTGNSASPTRQNTNMFRSILIRAGIDRVLETNVVCYSTPMSNHLCLPLHIGGKVRGAEIFSTLLHFVKPKVIIAHGAGTRDTLSAVLGKPLPALPLSPSPPQSTEIGGIKVFVIPSLAPPQWNKWSRWADSYLEKVAEAAANAL